MVSFWRNSYKFHWLMVISVVTGQSQSQSRSRPQEIVDTSFSFISCIYYFSSRCFWLQYYFYRVHICVVPCCTVHCPLSTVEGQQTIKLMLFFINTNTELRVSISTKGRYKINGPKSPSYSLRNQNMKSAHNGHFKQGTLPPF